MSGPPDPAHEIDRLRMRAERERAAREEAERIAESALRSLWLANQQLDERIAQRTEELRNARRAARAADRTRGTFLATLGHAIATPLHALLGLLELDGAPVDPRIRDTAERLNARVQRLLVLAAVAGDAIVLGPSLDRAADVADRLADRWTDRLAARGVLLAVEVHGAADDLVPGEWERLERIADALVENVERHADPGLATVSVSVGDTDVRLRVSDEGPGVPADRLDAIRMPFAAGPDTPGAAGGVGLCIVDMLCEPIGGSLLLERSPAGGLVAEVVLPRRGAPPQDRSPNNAT